MRKIYKMSEISSNNNNSDPIIKRDHPSDSNDAAKSHKKITSQNKPFTLVVIFVCGFSILYLLLKFITLKNDIKSNGELILDTPPNKIEGATIKITDLECNWERHNLNDESDPIIPSLTFKSSKFIKSGYLQILFLNSSGKIQGDPNIIRHDNKFIDTGNDDVTIKSTKGIANMLEFMDYRTLNEDYYSEKWIITIKESADGSAWSTLSSFKIPGSPINNNKTKI